MRKSQVVSISIALSVLVIGGVIAFANPALFSETSPTESSESANEADITMYKSPSCGCCTGWAEHMENQDFSVEVVESAEMMTVKEEQGIPRTLESCHTAVVGDYLVEGHVPYEAVEKLLNEQPDIAGIGMAGMPAGVVSVPSRS